MDGGAYRLKTPLKRRKSNGIYDLPPQAGALQDRHV